MAVENVLVCENRGGAYLDIPPLSTSSFDEVKLSIIEWILNNNIVVQVQCHNDTTHPMVYCMYMYITLSTCIISWISISIKL